MNCKFKPASGTVQIKLPNYFSDGIEIEINGAIGGGNFLKRDLFCGIFNPEFGDLNTGIIELNKNPILKHSLFNYSGWSGLWYETPEGVEEFFTNWNKCFIYGNDSDPRGWMSNPSILPSPMIASIDSPCGLFGNNWSKIDTGVPFTSGINYGSAHPPYDYFDGAPDFKLCTAIFRRDLKAVDCYVSGEWFGEGTCVVDIS